MLSCYWSKQSLYLAGVMLPGKTVKSIPSAWPVSNCFSGETLQNPLYAVTAAMTLKIGCSRKNINPRPQSSVKISEWVACLTDLPAFDLTYDLCMQTTFVHRSYLQENCVGKPFQLSARVHDFSPSVGCRVFVWSFQCWHVDPLISVVLFRCVF